ncbi:short subunit dehydrogenase [Pseudomonas sp. JUb52]|nr:short subunit dehydrogenase [Pseudomonas sp. JUb52]
MSKQIQGEKRLVIGDTRDMGLQTARLVLEQGGSVVIVGSRSEKTEQTRQELETLDTISALVANLTTAQGLTDLLREIDQHGCGYAGQRCQGVFPPNPS